MPIMKAAKALKQALMGGPKANKKSPLGVPPQDLSYFTKRLAEMKKRMRKHPLRNSYYDPEVRAYQLAEVDPIELDPTTSRQVRRQIARQKVKASKETYHQRTEREVNEETGSIKHVKVEINRPTLTKVYTGRYA